MTGPAVVRGTGLFAHVWLVAAAVGTEIDSTAAGWLVVVRQQRGRLVQREQHLTAGQRPPGAEPEPAGGAIAAELGGERQARGTAGRGGPG